MQYLLWALPALTPPICLLIICSLFHYKLDNPTCRETAKLPKILNARTV